MLMEDKEAGTRRELRSEAAARGKLALSLNNRRAVVMRRGQLINHIV